MHLIHVLVCPVDKVLHVACLADASYPHSVCGVHLGLSNAAFHVVRKRAHPALHASGTARLKLERRMHALGNAQHHAWRMYARICSWTGPTHLPSHSAHAAVPSSHQSHNEAPVCMKHTISLTSHHLRTVCGSVPEQVP